MATTMNKGMSHVICPYCKALMQSEVRPSKRHEGLFAGQFLCENCGAQSPIAWDCDKENTEARAWYLATEIAPRKYGREENRVMTLDEVLVFRECDKAIYCEIRGKSQKVAWLADVVVPTMELDEDMQKLLRREANGKPLDDMAIVSHSLPLAKNYGRTWRCWFELPTDEERENTPWGRR